MPLAILPPDTKQKLILGAWRWSDRPLSLNELRALLDMALECGISVLDQADIYGNYECEELYGEVLRENPIYREKFQIATKCGIMLATDKFPQRSLHYYDTSRDHIVSSAESSLLKMGIDKIDLLMIHRPDPLMEAEEVASAFSELKESGKVLHFGVSNFNRDQLMLLQSCLDFPLVTNQIELSLTHSEPFIDGSVDFLSTNHVPIMAWSPLGGGSIFSNDKLISLLEPIAAKYSCEISTLVLTWLLRHPAEIYPVVGTTNPTHLQQLSKAVEIDLDREDWFKMLKVSRGYDIP